MLIRSQNKKVLFNMTGSNVEVLENGKIYGYGNSLKEDSMWTLLGKYQTEEQAIAVLDLICDKYLHQDLKVPYIFRMPDAEADALMDISDKMEDSTFDVKYAVSLYGIRQDTYKDNDGSEKTAGLTFGPATGKSYVDTFASHTPTGVTKAGNPHRCIHDDDWETIAYWSEKDPYVYEQCIDGGGSGESCTKAVPIVLSDKIKGTSYPKMSGDGAGILYDSIKLEYRMWNAHKDDNYINKGGWPASRIRSTLNGRQPETTEVAWEDSPSGNYQVTEDKLCTETDSLFAGFPRALKEAIVPKTVKSDAVYKDVIGNNVVTYDKLWLLSGTETFVVSGSNNSVIRPNEGILYERITNLGITTSDFSKNEGYDDAGYVNGRWLRSLSRNYSSDAFSVYDGGDWRNNGVGGTSSLAPGFCIR